MARHAKRGTQQAVALALEAGGGEVPAETAEQIDLIEELGLEKTKRVVELQRAASRRLGGRQAGTRNRRTLEWANYLLSRYTSPLEVLAQIGATPTDQLAAGLKCTLLEALQERRLAAIALAPFVHQKQAIAVDVTNNKVVHLTIAVEAGDGPMGGDDREVLDLMVNPVKPGGEKNG